MNHSVLLRRRGWSPQVGGSLGADLPPVEAVHRYHERTKHRLEGFAAGPDALDWDAQPQPFRQWRGSPRALLPLAASAWPATWRQVHAGEVKPHALDRAGVALLLEMALGLTAWKQLGPDRWALRANPSSGNLHPTEAYVLSQAVPGLPDGLSHYAPRDHALELRAQGQWAPASTHAAPRLWLGLSSIAWREAWKYGERAFRYCQLDAGHALGAVRYAAAALGWRATWCEGLSHATLAHAMGLDRAADVGPAEAEEPEGLIAIWVPAGCDDQAGSLAVDRQPQADWRWGRDTVWHGRASRLDPRPMYQWPVIEEVAVATRQPVGKAPRLAPAMQASIQRANGDAPRASQPMSQVLRERRSAQQFDRRATLAWDAWVRLMAPLSASPAGCAQAMPLDAWPGEPQVQVVVYAHRVEGLAPGAYLLPRSTEGLVALRALLASAAPGGVLQPQPDWPGAMPLLQVAEHPTLSGTLRTLSCHQAIGSDACVAFSLLAPMGTAVAADPSAYRRLLQEAGLIGQALYVRAEAEGLRGTGIGCYFDDAVHTLLGLGDASWQVLYHFTVGRPLTDPRLQAEPPYSPDRLMQDTPFATPTAGDDA